MATLTAKEKAERAARAAATRAAKQAQANSAAAKQADAAPEAPAVHDKAPAGEIGRTVVVVSKIPRGIYLQLFTPVTQPQKVMGGGIQNQTIYMRRPEKIRLRPTVLPFGALPNYPMESGFSINADIDANFWRQWLEQNKSAEYVTAGLIAAFDDEKSARSYCREHAALKHGLEPIAQSGDERVEKSNNANLTDIDIESDKAA